MAILLSTFTVFLPSTCEFIDDLRLLNRLNIAYIYFCFGHVSDLRHIHLNELIFMSFVWIYIIFHFFFFFYLWHFSLWVQYIQSPKISHICSDPSKSTCARFVHIITGRVNPLSSFPRYRNFVTNSTCIQYVGDTHYTSWTRSTKWYGTARTYRVRWLRIQTARIFHCCVTGITIKAGFQRELTTTCTRDRVRGFRNLLAEISEISGPYDSGCKNGRSVLVYLLS